MYSVVTDMINKAGKRKIDKEIYESDIKIWHELMMCIIASSDAELIFIWGRPCKDALCNELRDQGHDISKIAGCEPAILYDIQFRRSNVLKTFVCLPHPESIQRYANEITLDAVMTILDELQSTFPIKFDTSRIHARLLKIWAQQKKLAKRLRLRVNQVVSDDEDDINALPIDNDFGSVLENLKPVVFSQAFLDSVGDEDDFDVFKQRLTSERARLRQNATIDTWTNQGTLSNQVWDAVRRRILIMYENRRILLPAPKKADKTSTLFAQWQRREELIKLENARYAATAPWKGESEQDLHTRNYEHNQAIAAKRIKGSESAESVLAHQRRQGYRPYPGEAPEDQLARKLKTQEKEHHRYADQKKNGRFRKAGEPIAAFVQRAQALDQRAREVQAGISMRQRENHSRQPCIQYMKTCGMTDAQAVWYTDVIRGKRMRKTIRWIDWYTALHVKTPCYQNWLKISAGDRKKLTETPKAKKCIRIYVQKLMDGTMPVPVEPTVEQDIRKREKRKRQALDDEADSADDAHSAEEADSADDVENGDAGEVEELAKEEQRPSKRRSIAYGAGQRILLSSLSAPAAARPVSKKPARATSSRSSTKDTVTKPSIEAPTAARSVKAVQPAFSSFYQPIVIDDDKEDLPSFEHSLATAFRS